MSYKRKSTKPTRVSNAQMCYDPIKHTPESLSNRWSTQNLLDSSASNLTSGFDAAWQVSLPLRTIDCPTMVTHRNALTSSWTATDDVDHTDLLSPDLLTIESSLENSDINPSLSTTERSALRKSRRSRYKFSPGLQVDVKYKCEICHYCTNRSDHYKRHMIIHSEDKPMKCSTCGYGTGRSDHFRRHLIRHGLNKEEILNQCRMNGIKTLPSTQIHARDDTSSKHTDNVLFDNNAKSTVQQSSSVPQEHLFNSTDATKKFCCDVCGYGTDRSSHYNRHLKTHSEDRPFCCNTCGKKFKLETYLRKHRCSVTLFESSPKINAENAIIPESTFSVLPEDTSFSCDDVNDVSTSLSCVNCGVWFYSQDDFVSHMCRPFQFLGNV